MGSLRSWAARRPNGKNRMKQRRLPSSAWRLNFASAARGTPGGWWISRAN